MCSIAHDNLLVCMHMSVCCVCVCVCGGEVRAWTCARAIVFSCVCVCVNLYIYCLDLMLLYKRCLYIIIYMLRPILVFWYLLKEWLFYYNIYWIFSVIGEPEEECVCVRAWVRACVRGCVRACVWWIIYCLDLIYYFINDACNLYVVLDWKLRF